MNYINIFTQKYFIKANGWGRLIHQDGDASTG
jgi:hypothetical protein